MDGLLGEFRPSAYLANAAVCNICITSELPFDPPRRTIRSQTVEMSTAGKGHCLRPLTPDRLHPGNETSDLLSDRQKTAHAFRACMPV
jgi:hypothetical protein